MADALMAEAEWPTAQWQMPNGRRRRAEAEGQKRKG